MLLEGEARIFFKWNSLSTLLLLLFTTTLQSIIEFLLYRGVPRPIWPAKYYKPQAKLFKGTRGEVKCLISRKSCCTQFYRLLEEQVNDGKNSAIFQ